MKKYATLLLSAAFLGTLLTGCNRDEVSSATPSANVSAVVGADKLVLVSEPGGAQGVLAVRKEAKNEDSVVVAGRVGGSVKPMVDGRAAFTIVDLSFKPCNAREGDDCRTPWDYCCETKEDLARATLMVKFVDAEGKTISQDAKTLLGVQPLQKVVVTGRAKKDADGNVTVIAEGIYIDR